MAFGAGLAIVGAGIDRRLLASALEAKFGEPKAARMVWKPQNTIPLDDEKAETVFKMLEALDDNDDVQQVYANFEMSDSVMEKMSA